MSDEWFFDRLAPLYDRLMPSANRGPFEAGLQWASGDVVRVVDLAGGSGRVGRELAPDYDVTVYDLSRPMLRQARRHGLPAVQATATRLPLPDESVDAVVIADAYHHLPEPGVVLREVVRVLRPGGVVVVQEFDPKTVRGRFVELGERVLGWPCQFRTPEGLMADLQTAGFDTRVVAAGFQYTVVGRTAESTT
jgi:demethylmenaquinone methyltransferase/2-methoxy-6-polyprenyl-1,4-benzoquinol methylase